MNSLTLNDFFASFQTNVVFLILNKLVQLSTCLARVRSGSKNVNGTLGN